MPQPYWDEQGLKQYLGSIGAAAVLTGVYLAIFLIAEILYHESIYQLLNSTWGTYSLRTKLLSPWVHTSHSNFLNNLALLVLSAAAVERKTGTKILVIFTGVSGYYANLLPPMIGIGSLGVGISGTFYGLWAFVAILYLSELLDDAFNGLHYSSILTFLLFSFGLTITVKGVSEFFGLSTFFGLSPPGSGIALGAHFIGVLLGILLAFVWLATTGRSQLPKINKPEAGVTRSQR